MKYYALIYYVVDDYITRRTPFRDEHLRRVNEAHARGELIMAGAFSDPAGRALLIFYTEGTAVIEEFINNDPYIKNGLVVKREIRPWTVVAGGKS
jgi:uncharacterized protein